MDSFETALQIYPLEDILPGVENVEEGIKIYLKYVSKETQKRDGVCVIELED